MKLDQQRFKQVLGAFLEMGVIAKPEIDRVMEIFAPTFPWAASLAVADSVHVHVRVDDVTRLRTIASSRSAPGPRTSRTAT